MGDGQAGPRELQIGMERMIELWAEAGPCENDVDKALKHAEAAYTAGANALKVQWYRAETLTVPTASRYDNTSGPATNQYEMFLNSIYPYERWEPVIDYCKSVNLRFIPSVFDFEAVDVANKFELPLLKMASGEITNHSLLNYASEDRQLAISTGAATIEEVEQALTWVTSGPETILMACHLQYPTPFASANIARTYVLQANFPYCIPGFSDHTEGVETIPLIVASGCQVIEKHFTLKAGQGYDSDFALDPTGLRNAVLKIQGTVAVMGNAELEPTAGELAARAGARRSPYARVAIPAGQEIRPEDIVNLRPFYGLDPMAAPRLVGRSFEHDTPAFGQFPDV